MASLGARVERIASRYDGRAWPSSAQVRRSFSAVEHSVTTVTLGRRPHWYDGHSWPSSALVRRSFLAVERTGTTVTLGRRESRRRALSSERGLAVFRRFRRCRPQITTGNAHSSDFLGGPRPIKWRGYMVAGGRPGLPGLFLGGEIWIRPDSLKWKWRVVVGQWATLKADHTNLLAEDNLVLAA